MTSIIAKRELYALFRSPLAWVIAVVIQIFFAWYFLTTLEQYLAIQSQLAVQDHAPGVTAFLAFRFLAPCTALLILICPLLTMRTLSDEYRNGTFALLQSSPLPVTSIIAGKFIGVLAFVSALLLLALIMPLSLVFFTQIDLATLALSMLGMFSVAALCTSVGLFFSSLTKHTLIAAMASMTLLLLLWVIGKGSFSSVIVDESIKSLSTSTHLGSFFQGLLDSKDISYFVILTLLFLGFSVIRLNSFQYSEAPGQ